MKKIIVVILILLDVVNIINAQIKIGPRIGANLANFGGDISDNTIRLKPQIGGLFEVESSKLFSFQTGFLYSGKGATFDPGEGNKDAITLEYFEIPLNGLLNIDFEIGYLQIFTGLYLGYCSSAKYKQHQYYA